KSHVLGDIQGQLTLNQSAKVVIDSETENTKSYTFIRLGDESEKLHIMTKMNGNICSTRFMCIGHEANKKKCWWIDASIISMYYNSK
ncbi:hypothetical protein MTR67_026448, partial [Solanum verrucosum]